jgi:hypothetical protein
LPTRTAYRRALASEIGGFTLTNTSGIGTTTTVEVSKQLLSSALPTSAVAYQWLYVPSMSGINQARITRTGLNVGTGFVTLEGPLQALVGSAVTIELHSLLPAVEDSHSHLGGGSLDVCVNRALRHIYTEDDSVTVPLISGAFDYSLAAYRDLLDQPERLIGVRQANGAGTTTHESFHRWELRDRASGPVLHFFEPFAFLTGSPSATLVLRRRASTLIAVSGTWGISTTGLVSESDEAKPSINDVTTVALYFAYMNLAQRNQGAARTNYLARAEAQLALAQQVKGFELATEEMNAAPAPVEAV